MLGRVTGYLKERVYDWYRPTDHFFQSDVVLSPADPLDSYFPLLVQGSQSEISPEREKTVGNTGYIYRKGAASVRSILYNEDNTAIVVSLRQTTGVQSLLSLGF